MRKVQGLNYQQSPNIQSCMNIALSRTNKMLVTTNNLTKPLNKSTKCNKITIIIGKEPTLFQQQ
jgi:hypothetical protein